MGILRRLSIILVGSGYTCKIDIGQRWQHGDRPGQYLFLRNEGGTNNCHHIWEFSGHSNNSTAYTVEETDIRSSNEYGEGTGRN
jgi:hypothetical protein